MHASSCSRKRPGTTTTRSVQPGAIGAPSSIVGPSMRSSWMHAPAGRSSDGALAGSSEWCLATRDVAGEPVHPRRRPRRSLHRIMSGSRLRRGSSLALAVMLGLTTLTMVLGAGLKSPCADRSWVEDDTRSQRPVLLRHRRSPRTEQLADGRLPYLERCDVAAKPCDEYPLVSMYVMRLTASWPGGGDPYTTFFWVNVVLLLACALVITWSLERLGAATALFAVAPTLLIYGTMNWDVVPVAFATVATFAFLRRREVASGVLLPGSARPPSSTRRCWCCRSPPIDGGPTNAAGGSSWCSLRPSLGSPSTFRSPSRPPGRLVPFRPVPLRATGGVRLALAGGV